MPVLFFPKAPRRPGLAVLAAVVALASRTPAETDRLDIARRLAASGDHAKAVPEFVLALETRPNDPRLWTELAESRLAAGQVPGAISDFSRAVRLDPGSVRAQKGLATAVERSGNKERALVEWRRLAQISEGADRSSAEDRIARLLGTSAPEAVETAAPPAHGDEHAAPLPPAPAPRSAARDGSTPELRKAVELWKAGKRDQALEAIRPLVRSSPSPELYYLGGLMRLEAKDWDKAEFNLRKAAASPAYKGSALYWLGRASEGRKRPADARTAWKQSLAAAPTGPYAAEIRARLAAASSEAGGGHPAAAHPPASGHEAPAATAHAATHEPSPPLATDSVRDLYSWTPPAVAAPHGDATEAGKLLTRAAEQLATGEHDVALSTLEQLRLKFPGTPAAELAGLSRAATDLAMGLLPNAQADADDFLRDHGDRPEASQARWIKGLAFLRAGNADSAVAILSTLHHDAKSVWRDADRQSALAQGLRLQRRYGEAAAALRLAFQAETSPAAKRSLALRMVRECRSARTPAQALPVLAEARKGCDRGPACLQITVSQADILWGEGKAGDALALYNKVGSEWSSSDEAPWALYQTGNAQRRLGRDTQATAAWKSLIAKHPESYWAGQARLRLEDAVWRGRYQEKSP